MAQLDDRGGRDAAGFGPYFRSDADLVPLRSLGDWRLAKGEPDIRGWEVRTVSGRPIGTIRDLLVDRVSREVVLLDIDLSDGHRRARAPIRSAQIDRVARVIRMDSADLLGEDAVTVQRAEQEGYAERGARVERVVPRTVAPAADLADRDRAEELREERVAEDARRAEAERVAEHREYEERQAERLADGSVDEKVVERRPVVYEEVVVRRRAVDADDANAPRDSRDPAAADRETRDPEAGPRS